MIDPQLQHQMDQALSEGKLRPDELPAIWWSRYLIDRPGFSLGFDLTSWALPVNIAAGRSNLHIQVLCVDMDFYWGDAL